MRRTLVLFALLLLLPSCGTEPAQRATGVHHGGLERLTEWMTGSFSSAAQAEADKEFFDIRLEMARIWPDRRDGVWFYVEQAVAAALDRPYRQRVYRVTHVGDDVYESRVYELADAKAAIGAWKQAEPLVDLSPDELVERDGASIYLRDRGEHYEGSTLGRMCKSNFRGASYATSEVTVHPDRLVSWDRGYDDDGKQVWGAVKAGYIFVKQ